MAVTRSQTRAAATKRQLHVLARKTGRDWAPWQPLKSFAAQRAARAGAAPAVAPPAIHKPARRRVLTRSKFYESEGDWPWAKARNPDGTLTWERGRAGVPNRLDYDGSNRRSRAWRKWDVEDVQDAFREGMGFEEGISSPVWASRTAACRVERYEYPRTHERFGVDAKGSLWVRVSKRALLLSRWRRLC